MTADSLRGKTFVVTGANSGIGLSAARRFAELGASVALVCRSEQRGAEAIDAIHRHTGEQNCRLFLADFASLASVSAMADRLLAEFPRIDVLCNNAGGANASRVLTEEGFETTFVSNHLSGFLLTRKLLPALRAAGQEDLARVVFTSSYGHTNSPLDFDDLGLEKGYSTLKAYGRSKLMNLLTARQLQRQVADANIVASSFHPGAVRTPIWKKGGLIARVLGIAVYPFMVDIEQGADTLIWLASSNDAASREAAGRYFYKRRAVRTAEFATEEAARRLWEVSAELVAPFE